MRRLTIVGAANIQLAATVPNLLIIEGIQDWSGFHADLLTTPVTWEVVMTTAAALTWTALA